LIRKEQISGVVLAGGKSSRFGSDKSELIVNGKTLLERSLDLMRSCFSEICISTNNPQHAKYGFTTIEDAKKNLGPLGGIYSVLENIQTEYAFFISLDMPFLTLQTIEKMVAKISGQDVIVPKSDWKIEPLCGIYRKSIVKEIENQIEKRDYKLLNLYKNLDVEFINFAASEKFININSPADYQKYASKIQ
jgi:molybdopterin-guanine dinucleotide biosynthesis protein A